MFRDLPLDHIHPDALKAAEAANCAGDQNKYWDMHALLFANQAHLDMSNLNNYAVQLNIDLTRFNDCLGNEKYVDEIRHDVAQAQEYRVNRTPTFFINGWRVVGADPAILRATLEDSLREGANK